MRPLDSLFIVAFVVLFGGLAYFWSENVKYRKLNRRVNRQAVLLNELTTALEHLATEQTRGSDSLRLLAEGIDVFFRRFKALEDHYDRYLRQEKDMVFLPQAHKDPN